jgi:NifU-like protein
MSDIFSYAPSYYLEESFLKKSTFLTYLGFFDEETAALKNMLIATGKDVSDSFETSIIHLLIDQEDGVIADVKFQVFGRSIDYLTLEALAELVLLKTLSQVGKITAELIEKHLKKSLKGPLPKFFDQAINRSLFALDEALRKCDDIQIAHQEIITPLEQTQDSFEVPQWMQLPLNEQIDILEGVIARDIRPYIELDEGGIEIVSLKEGIFLTIGYTGACSTCHSSTGSTLKAIEQILRQKVFPALVVIPDASWLKMGS